MQPSFAAVRERYLEELIEHEWYDVRTFGKKQRQEMTAPEYLMELLQHGRVTAVEMHSHTPRSDGLIEPERIGAWTHALYKKGYFRHEYLAARSPGIAGKASLRRRDSNRRRIYRSGFAAVVTLA